MYTVRVKGGHSLCLPAIALKLLFDYLFICTNITLIYVMHKPLPQVFSWASKVRP